jgi:hypothetical protein
MDTNDLKRLAGIIDKDEGSNISITGNEKGELQKKHNIKPGTDEWFRLWFSRPYLTGISPIDPKYLK